MIDAPLPKEVRVATPTLDEMEVVISTLNVMGIDISITRGSRWTVIGNRIPAIVGERAFDLVARVAAHFTVGERRKHPARRFGVYAATASCRVGGDKTLCKVGYAVNRVDPTARAGTVANDLAGH